MKNFLFITLLFISATATAQSDPAAATLNKINRLPSFMITKVPDSSAFTDRQLNSSKPLMLVFFNPDCDHCQKETKELMAWKEEMKDIQIVMLSPTPYSLIKSFYEDYNIASMHNIVMGQDINYKLGSVYRPGTYPAMYLYNKEKELLKVYIGNTSMSTIINAFK